MDTTMLAPMTQAGTADGTLADTDDDTYVEEELLVEEISIDGMCGVY